MDQSFLKVNVETFCPEDTATYNADNDAASDTDTVEWGVMSVLDERLHGSKNSDHESHGTISAFNSPDFHA